MIYALCGRSRAGKTTVLKQLRQVRPSLDQLVTVTTRAPRAEEVNHVDYHFVSLHAFQDAVQAGQIVCPIRYRNAWYGTARADLANCASRTVITVLRPDKLDELQAFTPLLGIYLSGPEEHLPVSPDDRIILAHQQRCQYHVRNTPGALEQAVEHILDIIDAHTRIQETRHGEINYHLPEDADVLGWESQISLATL